MDYGFLSLVTLGGNRSPVHNLVEPVLMGLYVDGDVVFAINEIVPDMGDRVVAIRASIEGDPFADTRHGLGLDRPFVVTVMGDSDADGALILVGLGLDLFREWGGGFASAQQLPEGHATSPSQFSMGSTRHDMPWVQQHQEKAHV